jgi:hypothetical protein
MSEELEREIRALYHTPMVRGDDLAYLLLQLLARIQELEAAATLEPKP